jgi:MFS family permease
MQKGGPYAWWVACALTLIASLSFVDRQILSLLIGPIRHDLAVSDTGIGLLTGLAFAAFFALMGVPLGRIADRGHRVGLIAVGMSLWSLTTSLSGLARSFPALLAARMGVGVGEASLTPSAYSLFADYFPPKRLGRAIAVYTLAVYLGMGGALLLGAALVRRLSVTPVIHAPLVGDLHPWQATMLCVGLLSLVFLPLLATVREPERVRETVGDAAAPAVIAQLKDNWRPYLLHMLGFSLCTLLAVGILTWAPEMFYRRFDWPPSRTGTLVGAVLLAVCGPATLAAGWLNDRLGAAGIADAPLKIGVAVLGLVVLCIAVLAMAPTASLAAAALCALVVLLSIPGMLAPTALQLITPGRMRGQVSALYVACSNLVGAGLGPLAVGAASDMLFHGHSSLRSAIVLTGLVAAPAAALLLLVGCRPFAVLRGRVLAE